MSNNRLNSASQHTPMVNPVANDNQNNQFRVSSSFHFPNNQNSHPVQSHIPGHHSTNLNNVHFNEPQSILSSQRQQLYYQHQDHVVTPNLSHYNISDFIRYPVSGNNHILGSMTPYVGNDFNVNSVNSNHVIPNNNCIDFSKAYFRLSQAHRSILKFDGKNQTLHNFLERVEEFCMAHRVNRDQLLTFSHELLEVDVLILFRSIRATCKKWQDLV